MTEIESRLMRRIERLYNSTIFMIWMTWFKSGAELLESIIDDLDDPPIELLEGYISFTTYGIRALVAENFTEMQAWWAKEYPDSNFLDVVQVVAKGFKK